MTQQSSVTELGPASGDAVPQVRWRQPKQKLGDLQLALTTARKRSRVAWGVWGGSYVATSLAALAVGFDTWETELAYIFIPGYGPIKAAVEVEDDGVRSFALATGLLRFRGCV